MGINCPRGVLGALRTPRTTGLYEWLAEGVIVVEVGMSPFETHMSSMKRGGIDTRESKKSLFEARRRRDIEGAIELEILGEMTLSCKGASTGDHVTDPVGIVGDPTQGGSDWARGTKGYPLSEVSKLADDMRGRSLDELFNVSAAALQWTIVEKIDVQLARFGTA